MRRLIAVFLLCVIAAAMRCDPAAAATTTAVTMDHYAFGPSSLTVHVGDTVVWTNHDAAPHDVTTTSAPVGIHSPTLTTGKSWQYTFTVAGVYQYICSIHPDMKAQVTVLPVPAPTPTHTHTATTPAAAPHTTAPVVAAAPSTHVMHPSRTTAHSSASPTASPTTVAAVAVAPNTTPPGPTLKPMLWVAGAVSAVAVFCLLVLAARPETAE